MLTRIFSRRFEDTVGEQVADRAPAAEAVEVQTAVEASNPSARVSIGAATTRLLTESAFHDMGGVADRSFHRADLAAVELERDIARASGQIDGASGRTASAIETTGGSGA